MKYFEKPDNKNKVYSLTESQIRDHEIRTTYMVLVKEGRQSYDVIRQLSKEYFLSAKKIEQIVYPTQK